MQLPHLKKSDPQMAKLIAEEIKRQQETLDLIPSENIVSSAVLEALGSRLTDKYSEGYPGKRYYGGCRVVDKIELLCQERARKTFRLGKVWHVNVQPLSGSPANMAVYYALLEPGATILGMTLSFGGHLTHGARGSFSSKLYRSVQYTLRRDGYLDYEAIKKLAHKERPKIIVAGATAYSRIIDFKKFRKIADSVGAYFMVDMAHIAGLVAGGAHPSPFPYADIVTTTTHKSLRGPRGGLIFANTNAAAFRRNGIDIAKAIDKAIIPGLQGGPHNHQTAAIAVALGEAARPSFRRYARQVVKNAKVLARELTRRGFNLVSGGTDNHLMLIDVTNMGVTGHEAQDQLEEVGIVTNRNTVPYEPRSPFDPSGIRIGTPSLTTRGMKEREMRTVARLIHEALTEKDIRGMRKEVQKLCHRFPIGG